MKANTIQLLIAMVAVFGTLSAGGTQAFADDNSLDALCEIDRNGVDEHELVVTVVNTNDVSITAYVNDNTPVQDSDASPSADGINLVDFELRSEDGTTLIDFDTGGTALVNGDPTVFDGNFDDLDDGHYLIVACYRVGFPEMDSNIRGTYHGDSQPIWIDTTAPECTAATDISVDAAVDTNGVPATDPEIEAFIAEFGCEDLGDGASGVDTVVFTRSDMEPLSADYPAGETTTVTLTCTDLDGNESTCNADVMVNDPPAPPGCESEDLEGAPDMSSDKHCHEGNLQQPTCGLDLQGTGALDYGEIASNELSIKLFFDVIATGSHDGLLQAFKISCDDWVSPQDDLVMFGDVTHMAQTEGDLYGNGDNACQDFEKRFSVLTTDEVETVWVQFQAILENQDYAGGVTQDIFLDGQECPWADSDLDECTGLPLPNGEDQNYGFPPLNDPANNPDQCEDPFV